MTRISPEAGKSVFGLVLSCTGGGVAMYSLGWPAGSEAVEARRGLGGGEGATGGGVR